jgi:hypothetical protein
MQTHTRNPTTWLTLLVTLLACLAVQSLGHKTASGQIYEPQAASWESTPLQAAPRLGLRGLVEENVSAPPVGANGGDALNAQATLSVSKVTAPFDFDGHILSAEVKPNGTVVGGHSTASGNVQVIPGTAGTPNAQGVYSARIEVADPNNPGQFLPKTNNGGVSTLFPDSWTADRIKVEVDAAFQNRTVVGNKWTGTTPSGVKVEGYLNPKTTVYPKL